MTINKAHGKTIPNVGLYLPQNAFSHGQLYVALSKGISMAQTKVLVMIEQPDRHKRTYTRKIVYKEVLAEIQLLPRLEESKHGKIYKQHEADEILNVVCKWGKRADYMN